MRSSLVCIPALAVVLLVGCFGQPYRPQPLEDVPFLARAETRERSGLRVRAAVPSAEEAEAIFGIPVYERRVQPVRGGHGLRQAWIEIGRARLAHNVASVPKMQALTGVTMGPETTIETSTSST